MFSISKGHVAHFVEGHRNPDAIWLMHHIPKTAGSSLSVEMQRALGADRTMNLRLDYGSGPAGLQRSREAQVDAVVAAAAGPTPPRAINGHLRRRDVDRLVQEVPNLRLMAFLRYPVRRVISEYDYCLSPLHPHHESFAREHPTIESFIASESDMNRAAKMMLGPRLDMSPAEAAERVVERYDMIGLQERYPASFLLMSALVWTPSTPSVKSRVGTRTVEPNPKLRRAIARVNRHDMAIYNRVRTIYEDVADEIWDTLGRRSAPI